jgi:glutamine amidotransferase
MAALARSGLETEIRRSIDDGGWYLGVCLGMQLLFDRSDEDGAAGSV